jgi:hypothetical protein
MELLLLLLLLLLIKGYTLNSYYIRILWGGVEGVPVIDNDRYIQVEGYSRKYTVGYI